MGSFEDTMEKEMMKGRIVYEDLLNFIQEEGTEEDKKNIPYIIKLLKDTERYKKREEI